MKRAKTIILDIDGTIVYHHGTLSLQLFHQPALLEDVQNKFDEWDKKGYRIILITGRKESSRKATEEFLQSYSLFWDQLIMGVGGGQRVLINDLKPDSQEPTAVAINITRNQGLKDIDI